MAVEPWKRIEPTIHVKVDRRTVILKTFELPDEKPHVFATFIAENERSGGVIALTPDLKVIVAKQYRPGPEKIMYEIPGGGINEGEDPEAGVLRELREETGYISEHVNFLGTSCRDAYVNATWYYYLALDCKLHDDGQELDEHEYVDVELITIEQFIDNAKSDKMTDPVAVLLAYEKLKELQEKANA